MSPREWKRLKRPATITNHPRLGKKSLANTSRPPARIESRIEDLEDRNVPAGAAGLGSLAALSGADALHADVARLGQGAPMANMIFQPGDRIGDLIAPLGERSVLRYLSAVGLNGFDEAISPVVASKPQLVAMGQFNARFDSIPDIFVSNQDGSYSVLLGDGRGGFRLVIPVDTPNGPSVNGGEIRYLPGIASPEGVAAGDFNLDGYTDVALAGYGDGNTPGTVKVLLSNGQGQFQEPITLELPAGAGPTYLTAGYLDGDDPYLDLVVSDFNNNQLLVYRGQGDGTFRHHDTVTTGVFNPNQTVVSDFDGDGLNDVAVANKGDGSVGVFRGVGGGYITAAATYRYKLEATDSIGIAAGDLDGDGKVDLAVASLSGTGRLSVLLNNSVPGDPSFILQPAIEMGGDHLINVVIADLNQDGFGDLAASSVSADPNRDGIFTLYNKRAPVGSVAFTNTEVNPRLNGTNPIGLIAADVNRDGKPDLVAAVEGDNSVNAYINTGVYTDIYGVVARQAPRAAGGLAGVVDDFFSSFEPPAPAPVDSSSQASSDSSESQTSPDEVATGEPDAPAADMSVDAGYPGDSGNTDTGYQDLNNDWYQEAWTWENWWSEDYYWSS